jgi:hypothetical protein
MLHGGRRPVDIYRRIYSGINGTPMPSSKDPNTAIGETPELRSDRIWHLVHFITAVIDNNGVPDDAQQAIDDMLRHHAPPPTKEPAAEPAPELPGADDEKRAAGLGQGDRSVVWRRQSERSEWSDRSVSRRAPP